MVGTFFPPQMLGEMYAENYPRHLPPSSASYRWQNLKLFDSTDGQSNEYRWLGDGVMASSEALGMESMIQ
ncbi:hypothetical protein CA54_56180 [Symmachiella macrocystis]|uniref:Uncharacterized protein n=1 Tax=Symmachiella macrocystis TaxID=2527985 RepID=A0A5C6B4X0_9PLAN|nr:hypothetical protein CA54_56180 [Symmachiella macrocystis]